MNGSDAIYINEKIAQKWLSTAIYIARNARDDDHIDDAILSIYGWLLYTHLAGKSRWH